MTTDLVTAREGISLSKAQQILRQSRKGKLPIVDEHFNLTALLARSDLIKTRDYPWASMREASRQLLCAAAISTHVEDRARLDALVKAGVCIYVLVFNHRLIYNHNQRIQKTTTLAGRRCP